MPAEPILFNKAPSCIVGPDDAVVIPRGSEKTDWEGELAVVIGKRASYVSEAEALDYVAGYCVEPGRRVRAARPLVSLARGLSRRTRWTMSTISP